MNDNNITMLDETLSTQNEKFSKEDLDKLVSDFIDSGPYHGEITHLTNLPVFDSVRRGAITSQIVIAKEYYLDPRNQEGTLQQRIEKLNVVIRDVFTEFIKERTSEYSAVRIRQRGVDWNKPGNSSWRTMIAIDGYHFIKETIIHTTNGDWKGGPEWGPNARWVKWKTGGHSSSNTFCEVQGRLFQFEEKIIEELNQARSILHNLGIPTELP